MVERKPRIGKAGAAVFGSLPAACSSLWALRSTPKRKWGPALLPAPTAPSEGSAGVRELDQTRRSPVLDPGSPAQASLPTMVVRGSSHSRSSPHPEGCLASRTRFASPEGFGALIFRGPSWAGPLPRGLSPWRGNRLSRQKAPTLPAPLAGWSGFRVSPRHRPEGQFSFNPRIHRLPAEIGPSVPSSPSCRCRPPGGWDFRPDHPFDYACHSESRKAESCSLKPVDNGDIAHN